jgi:tight adherence protein C
MNLPRLLDYAGHPYGITAEEFFGLRILGAGIGGLLGLELGLIQRSLGGALVSGLILGAGGLFLAQLWLQAEASRRQRAISLGLPDVMDLLAIAVGAGLGLDEALVRTVETMEGPITEEFGTLIRELRLGVPRAEALGHLIDRNRSQELRAIVGALIQGHELGTPIRDVLHDQAASMRARRLQLAKEAAAEVSPRIALVLGLVMAPAVACLFIMILGYGLVDKLGPLFNLGSPIEALP